MEPSNEIRSSLSRIRRRWRRFEIVKVLAAGLVEIAGLVMVFMLADWLYQFRMPTRLTLLAAGAVVVAAILARQVVRVLARRITDKELALFVEQRNPELQGALLSATEFSGTQGSPLHNYIVEVLVTEANRRVHMVDVRRSVDLGRLKKYGLACMVVLVAFIATGAFFPQFLERQGRRILAPWVVRPGDDGNGNGAGDDFYAGNRTGPLKFRIVPGNVEVLEGATVEVVAELSRDPLGLDATLFIKTDKGEWEPLAMESVARLYTLKATLSDINRPLEYYVAVGNDQSEHHSIAVRQRLKITGVEMVTEFPSYLKRESEKALSFTGDIATLAGSKVTLDVKTNQPVREGYLVMGDGSKRPLDLGAAGGRITIPVDKEDTYRYVLRNAFGEEVGSDRLCFIQALEDKPPVMEVMEPNVDLTVHLLSEVTCIVNVTEDWALESVRIQMEVIRQGPNREPMRASEAREFKPAAWTGRVDAGAAEIVLPLETLSPPLKPGDSIFYNFEVSDRKGQKVLSDLFFISIADPEVFVYYGKLDWHAPDEKVAISPMMQFIAAAWRLEQERAGLPKDEFLARCVQLADKMMDPDTGKVVDFIRLGANGDGKGPKLPDTDPRKKIAADHTEEGHRLLRSGEPGKAVVEFKIVWAILKQFFGDASIMLAGADVNNPNRVILEKGESFANIEQLANIDKREMDRELQKQADQQVAWRRMLGRKEREKVDEVRKDLEKIKKDVAAIAQDAREDPPKPPDAEGEPKDPTGKPKPGEQKPGDDDKKPGDEEKKGGDEEKKTGDADKKGGDEEKKTGEDDRKGGKDEKKESAPSKDDLKARALDAAKAAEDAARKLQNAVGDQKDKTVRDGLDRIRNAAEELKRAALDFDEKRLDAAAARADNAQRFLDDAGKDLDKATTGQLSELVAQALGQAHRLVDRQKTLGAATDALDKDAKKVADAKTKGDKTAPVQEEALREKQKGVSTAQNALSEQAEAFKGLVERVKDAAQAGDEKNAAAALDDGVKAMTQGELPQKMVDAAVDVKMGDFKRAKVPQDEASKTLSQVVDSLYRASDALSGTKEGVLERAARRARDIKKKSTELAGADEKTAPADPDRKPAPDETKTGKKTDDSEMSKRRVREEAAKLWGEVKTLAGELKPVEAVPQAAKDRLGEIGEAEFSQGFEDRDEKKVAEFLALITRVATVLDEKLVEIQTAKRLESGLRDECPPAYRRLVGRYYSILSAGE